MLDSLKFVFFFTVCFILGLFASYVIYDSQKVEKCDKECYTLIVTRTSGQVNCYKVCKHMKLLDIASNIEYLYFYNHYNEFVHYKQMIPIDSIAQIRKCSLNYSDE